MFVTLMLTVLILLVATCAPVHLDTLEMESHVLVRESTVSKAIVCVYTEFKYLDLWLHR